MTDENTIVDLDIDEEQTGEQETTPDLIRELVYVASKESVERFLNLLKEGYKLDPWLKPRVIEHGVIYHLLKINAEVYDIEDFNPNYKIPVKTTPVGEMTLSLPHGEFPPEGYALLDKNHVFSKVAVYTKLWKEE